MNWRKQLQESSCFEKKSGTDIDGNTSWVFDAGTLFGARGPTGFGLEHLGRMIFVAKRWCGESQNMEWSNLPRN